MNACRACRFWEATPKWRIEAPTITVGPSDQRRTCLAVPPTPWIDADGNQQELYPTTFSGERCGLWQPYEARLDEVTAAAPPMLSSYRLRFKSEE